MNEAEKKLVCDCVLLDLLIVVNIAMAPVKLECAVVDCTHGEVAIYKTSLWRRRSLFRC